MIEISSIIILRLTYVDSLAKILILWLEHFFINCGMNGDSDCLAKVLGLDLDLRRYELREHCRDLNIAILRCSLEKVEDRVNHLNGILELSGSWRVIVIYR